MNPGIYLDSDGLVADFHTLSMKIHGISIPYDGWTWNFWQSLGMTDEEFWAPLRNVDFWANLDVLEDGRRLFEKLKTVIPLHRFTVLSNATGPTPEATDAARSGKDLWFRKNYPDLAKHVVFSHHKERFAAPCKILVDDNNGNCDLFQEAGGRAILVPRPWNRRKPESNSETRSFDVDQVFEEIVAAWSKCCAWAHRKAE